MLVIRYFPWYASGGIAWWVFGKIRENRAMNVLERNEARNCGFINELPIVALTCGSMGKKKTTMTTDMALSQTVMFRQEAFSRLQKQDMKFLLVNKKSFLKMILMILIKNVITYF